MNSLDTSEKHVTATIVEDERQEMRGLTLAWLEGATSVLHATAGTGKPGGETAVWKGVEPRRRLNWHQRQDCERRRQERRHGALNGWDRGACISSPSQCHVFWKEEEKEAECRHPLRKKFRLASSVLASGADVRAASMSGKNVIAGITRLRN